MDSGCKEDGLGDAAGDAVGANCTDGEPAAGEGGGVGMGRGGGTAAVGGQPPVDVLVRIPSFREGRRFSIRLCCDGALGPEAARRRHAGPSPLRIYPPRMRLLRYRRR